MQNWHSIIELLASFFKTSYSGTGSRNYKTILISLVHASLTHISIEQFSGFCIHYFMRAQKTLNIQILKNNDHFEKNIIGISIDLVLESYSSFPTTHLMKGKIFKSPLC